MGTQRRSRASATVWGDYDNDGWLDILLTGSGELTPMGRAIAQVWRNTGNGFANVNVGLDGVHDSSVAWGDYDNDGRLDILLTAERTRRQEQPFPNCGGTMRRRRTRRRLLLRVSA
jgi:hypothetical protein